MTGRFCGNMWVWVGIKGPELHILVISTIQIWSAVLNFEPYVPLRSLRSLRGHFATFRRNQEGTKIFNKHSRSAFAVLMRTSAFNLL